MNVPRLALRGITKEYSGHRVLNDVSLEVAPGEIHALVGENGAGKSTLMNLLFGMPVIAATGGYAGEILLDGFPAKPRSPREALALGIGMVHQEFMLLPGFSVAENIKLNREPVRLPWLPGPLRMLDRPRLREEARAAMRRTGLDLDVDTPLGAFPVGHWQFVEIAREIDKTGLRVLVFDEPTAVLTEGEAARLLSTMRSLAKDGLAILFITHRLAEVKAVADRVTVLRDGEVAARLEGAQIDTDIMAERMIGRSLTADPRLAGLRVLPPETDPMLTIENLRVDMPGEPVRDVSLSLRRGEIFGLAGLAGQGKLGIANGLAGRYPATGSVRLDGTPFALGRPREALRRGLIFVPEDRRGAGLLLDDSVEENIVATAVAVTPRFSRWPGLGTLSPLLRQKVRRFATDEIARFDIRCTGPDQPVRRLSGGNQQKVCLARAAAVQPRLLMVSEPTRGIDVGAKALVLDVLRQMNREGVSIVMTSSELAELRSVCHRIAVIAEGRVAGILPPDAPDVQFGRLMGS